jgi:hypothetical protein
LRSCLFGAIPKLPFNIPNHCYLICKRLSIKKVINHVSFLFSREIHYLHEKLCKSEETIQRFQNLVKEKDAMMGQLQHRCQLLDNICKSRPLLDSMLSHMAEAERLGPVVGMGEPTVNTSLTDGESNCSPNRISNHKDFSLSEDDQELDEIVFGTTV